MIFTWESSESDSRPYISASFLNLKIIIMINDKVPITRSKSRITGGPVTVPGPEVVQILKLQVGVGITAAVQAG